MRLPVVGQGDIQHSMDWHSILLWTASLVLVSLAAALTLDDRMALPLILLPSLAVIPMLVILHAIAGNRMAILIVLACSIFLLEAVFRVRSYDEKVVDFQILAKVMSWLVLLCITLPHLGPTLRSLFIPDTVLWTILFSYIMATSILSPNPVHAAVAALSIMAFHFFLAGLSDRIEPERILLAILAGILALAFASIIVYFAVPSLGRMHVWAGNQHVLGGRMAGLAGHPNTVGRLCCFGVIILVSQWRYIRSIWRPAPLLMFTLLVIALLMTNSRTSIVIAMLASAFLIFGRARYAPYIFVLCTVAAFGLAVLIPYSEQVMVILSRSGNADEISTGTSRTLIWAVAETLIAQKPWFGWGYGSSVFIMPSYERYMGHAAPHAHNMILQLWLTTGLLGVLLFLAAFVSRLAIAIRKGERLVIVLLLYVMFIGLTEAGAFGGVANITTVALCLAASIKPARSLPLTEAVAAPTATRVQVNADKLL